MEEHKPYEQIRKRPCDFIVRYTFYTEEQGGRKTGTPRQGIRSDFMYDGDTLDDGLYGIWPEFLDENNNIILDRNIHVPVSGKAKMWMLDDNFFNYHKSRMKIGTRGYFMEGSHKTAECEVVEFIHLK